jgi:hypothetical protein
MGSVAVGGLEPPHPLDSSLLVGEYDNSCPRTVSLFSESLDSFPSLHKFKHLRVLDLEECEGLQGHHLAHLGGFFALRFLRLLYTNIGEILEEVGELRYLQTLNIRGTSIKELSSSVDQLARLVTLLYDDPNVWLSYRFGNIQALQ